MKKAYSIAIVHSATHQGRQNSELAPETPDPGHTTHIIPSPGVWAQQVMGCRLHDTVYGKGGLHV